MSIEVMNLVWKRSPERGSALLVLLAMADWADDNGWCYPSVNTLSFKARTSRRGAQKILDRLIAHNAIEKVRGNARKANRYRIKVENLTEARVMPEREKPQSLDDLDGPPGGVQGSPDGRTAFAPTGERGSPQGRTAFAPTGERHSPQGRMPFTTEANPVRLRGEPGRIYPSSDTSLEPSIDTGGGAPAETRSAPAPELETGGGAPPRSSIEERMRETERRQDERRRSMRPAAAPEVLPEPKSGEAAWGQLLAFWEGEFEALDPPVALPPRTRKAWSQIGGARRFAAWAVRPTDTGFALADFLKIWDSLAEEFNRDRIATP